MPDDEECPYCDHVGHVGVCPSCNCQGGTEIEKGFASRVVGSEVPTWPSIAELEQARGNGIPANLLALVSKRYEEHAPEYISDETHHSGKPYNKCMFADSLQDCEEEVIDAVFNAMVYNMRAELGAIWHRRPNLVSSLVEVWNLLQRIKEVEAQR